jgi:hypothetical protein
MFHGKNRLYSFARLILKTSFSSRTLDRQRGLYFVRLFRLRDNVDRRPVFVVQCEELPQGRASVAVPHLLEPVFHGTVDQALLVELTA